MYTEIELNSLIGEVEKEFTAHLAKAEESFKLAKSEDESEKDKSKEKEEPKAMESEKPEDKGAKDQHQDPSKESKGPPAEAKEGEATVAAPKEGEQPAAQAPQPQAEGEDHGYDDEDMQHMHSMYSSMSRAELKAHHDAVRKCMDSHGLAKCEDSMAKAEMEDSAKDAEGYRPNGGPKDGEAAKAKTPAAHGAQALEKSEKDVVVEVSPEVALLKSELEATKAESEATKKSLAAVEAFLTKFVEKTAPAGKAITSLYIISKNEGTQNEKPLTKSEIDAKLLIKAKDQSLSKSDRDAINSYYFTKNIEKVSHLLK